MKKPISICAILLKAFALLQFLVGAYVLIDLAINESDIQILFFDFNMEYAYLTAAILLIFITLITFGFGHIVQLLKEISHNTKKEIK